MFYRLTLIALLVNVSWNFQIFQVPKGEIELDETGGACCSGGACTIKCKNGLKGPVEAPGEPPKFVYRADFRKPKEIFQSGFACLGENDNLIEHTLGVSTHYGSKNTLFVSTSAIEEEAYNWGKRILEAAHDPTIEKAQKYKKYTSIYLYKMRADWNYFNMEGSLREGFKNTNDNKYRQQAEVARGLREYEACGGVNPEEIVSAKKYSWKNSQVTGPVSEEANPGYVDKDTKANSFIYSA